ncbi:MAG: hypothetical protein ACM3PY_05385 [Omnitrophica WOR_2 bacterium]
MQGLISQYWLSYFNGLTITVIGEDSWIVTTIIGYLPDQATLQGLPQNR